MQFEELIPDYLNDALDADVRRKFEEAMAGDPVLRARVEQESDWMRAMRSDAVEKPAMDFGTFEERIDKKPWWQLGGFEWINAPIAASACAVLLLALWIVPGIEETEPQQFETLTTPEVEYSHDVLRLIVHRNADISSLAEEYQLDVLQLYPSASAVDVSAVQMSVEAVRALDDDPRIRFVQRIEGR